MSGIFIAFDAPKGWDHLYRYTTSRTYSMVYGTKSGPATVCFSPRMRVKVPLHQFFAPLVERRPQTERRKEECFCCVQLRASMGISLQFGLFVYQFPRPSASSQPSLVQFPSPSFLCECLSLRCLPSPQTLRAITLVTATEKLEERPPFILVFSCLSTIVLEGLYLVHRYRIRAVKQR